MFDREARWRREESGRGRENAVSLTLYDQLRELAGVRADAPTCASMSAQVGRGVLRRLDLARIGFFERIKAGETPGFQKFEAARRWDSIEIPQPTAGMVKVDGRGEWANMNSVAMIESTRWADGKTTVHRRYFITSLPARADRILGAVREHWGVENGLHWTLARRSGRTGT